MAPPGGKPALCEAIDRRRVVAFAYRRRRVEVIPAAVGAHASSGEMVLRGYLLRATRRRRAGRSPWRLFRVRDMREVTVLEDTFDQPPPGYDPDTPLLWTAICQL